MCLIHLKQSYCLDGEAGSLLRSKIEFYARIVNSWDPLPINYCLKESTLDVTRSLNQPMIIR